MTKIVLGIFNEKGDAENAIERLKDEGYHPEDISIVMKGADEDSYAAENITAGTVSGATTGAILGGFAGLLSSLVIPGLGAFFIGGPLATALGLTGIAASTVSGAATGALAGGIFGALTGLGLSDEDARSYENLIQEGGILVAIPARKGEEAEVEQILSDTDAVDIKSITSKFATGEHGDSEDRDVQSDSFRRRPSYAYATAKGGKSTKGRNVKRKTPKKQRIVK